MTLVPRAVQRLAVVGFLLLAMLTGYAVTAGTASAVPTSGAASRWAATMLSTMNTQRAAHGMRPLHSRAALIHIAYGHGVRMGRYNTAAHRLPGELPPDARITHAGYTGRTGGENLAQTVDWTLSGAQRLQRAMYSQTSPGDVRRANLLNRAFRFVGVAITIDSVHHKLWVTQDFSISPAPRQLPGRVAGGYWPYYRTAGQGAYPLRAVPANVNVVYLFSARPVGGAPGTDGSVFFDQNQESPALFVDELRAIRAAGRRVVLSVGGAGEFIDLTSTARRNAFLASFRTIVSTSLGGVIDGLDWDLEGGAYATANMVYISQQLKRGYGTNFSITFAAAPYRQADKDLAVALLAGHALDFVAPQYYDLVGLSDDASQIANLRSRTDEWVRLVGAARVGLGLKNSPAGSTATMEPASCVTAWNAARADHPALKGVFVWNLYLDHFTGSDRFTTLVLPHVLAG